MNIFRLVADMSHLCAIIMLLGKIISTRSCAGLSGKSQLLFALVFTTRYLDIFLVFISFYNTFMKITYIILTYITVFCIYHQFKTSYEKQEDTFYSSILVASCLLLAIFINESSDLLEIAWTFSIYLESVAILPQLLMLSRGVQTGVITYHYLFLLAIYRALYIVNWVYRFHTEGWYDMISVVSGCVQTIFYCDFVYLYVKAVVKKEQLTLEV